MEGQTISGISPNGDAIPITVRIIRQWKPYIRRQDIAYLLIDKHGHAIQANVHYLDRDYFENKINLLSCYQIDNYICQHALSQMKITDHSATIRLGRTTIINPTDVPEEFPRYCFNLCDYNKLTERIGKKEDLSDYAGRLDSISRETTATGTQILRIKMTDISGKPVEATIWEEIIPRFNWEAMEKAGKPIIAVLTSTKVNIFLAKTQLLSTAATFIYFNPPIEEVASLISRFKAEEPQPAAQEQKQDTQLQLQTVSTISDIQEHKRQQQEQQKTFICEATITALATTSKWFYRQCPHCSRKMYMKKGKWSCGTHDDISEPNLMYTVGATITDETGEAQVTIFNNAANSLLETTCKKVVTEQGYDDQNTLPEPLYKLKGQKAMMHIQYTKDSYNLKLNKATPITNQPGLINTPPSPTSIIKTDHCITSAKRELIFKETGVSDTKRIRYPD